MEIDKHEIFSAHKARKYWKGLREDWKKAASTIESMIIAIEDADLRKAVAHIVDACSNCQGAYVLTEAPEGFKVEEVELDDEAIDPIIDMLGGNTDKLDEAYDWLVQLFKGMPAPFIAWAFGELCLRDPILNDEGEELKFFAFDRVVYSLKDGRILGIHTHPVFSHPRNRIVEVDLWGLR